MFGALISGVLWMMAAKLVLRVLGALGVAFYTYKGLNWVTDLLLNAVETQWGYLPVNIAQMASMFGIDTAITIVLSAYVGVISIKLATGAIKRVAFG